MSMTKRPKRQYSCEIVNLEDMVPKDHFLRVIDEYFDWNFIYEEVEKLYSKLGRKSIESSSFDKDSYIEVSFS